MKKKNNSKTEKKFIKICKKAVEKIYKEQRSIIDLLINLIVSTNGFLNELILFQFVYNFIVNNVSSLGELKMSMIHPCNTKSMAFSFENLHLTLWWKQNVNDLGYYPKIVLEHAQLSQEGTTLLEFNFDKVGQC